jgi:hypothetical protein
MKDARYDPDARIAGEGRGHARQRTDGGPRHQHDFDSTMLRIGSMNMLLHGVENPDIRHRDSLADEHASDEEAYTLVLANPPFADSLPAYQATLRWRADDVADHLSLISLLHRELDDCVVVPRTP